MQDANDLAEILRDLTDRSRDLTARVHVLEQLATTLAATATDEQCSAARSKLLKIANTPGTKKLQATLREVAAEMLELIGNQRPPTSPP